MWQSEHSNGDELRHACLHNDVATVRKLRKLNNVNIEIEDSNCTTPLMLACYYGNYDVVYELISNQNALIDHGNNMGANPLHYACEQQHIEIVKLLLDNNANINIQTKKGYTPLHYAATTNNFELCKLLLLCGANKTAKDIYGQSAVNIVNKKKRTDIICLFQLETNDEIKKLQSHRQHTNPLKSIKSNTHSIELEKERIMRGEISTLKDILNEISYENDRRVDKLMQRIGCIEDYVQGLSVSVHSILETPKFRNMHITVPQKQHIVITEMEIAMDIDTPITELNTPMSDRDNVPIDLHTDIDIDYEYDLEQLEDDGCRDRPGLHAIPSLRPEANSLDLGGFSDDEGTTMTGTAYSTTPKLANIVQDEVDGIDADAVLVHMSPITEYIDDGDVSNPTPTPAMFTTLLKNQYNSSPVAPTPYTSPHKPRTLIQSDEHRQRAKTESKYANYDGIAPHINDDDIHNYPDLDDAEATYREIVISEEEYVKLMGARPETVRHHSDPIMHVNRDPGHGQMSDIAIPNTIGMLGIISPTTVDAVRRSTLHHEEMTNAARKFESGTFYSGRKISVKLKKAKARRNRTKSAETQEAVSFDRTNNRTTYNSSKKIKNRKILSRNKAFKNRQSVTPQPFNKKNVDIKYMNLKQSVTPQPSSSTYVSASFSMKSMNNNNNQKLYNDSTNNNKGQSLRNRKKNNRKKMRKKKTFSPTSIVYVDD